MHYILSEKKSLFEKAVDHTQKELSGIRTGRASTALVEGLKISVYGAPQDLKNVAAIAVPDSQTIQIEPWDESNVKEIEKAIMDSDINLVPNTAGKIIRLSIPPLTEDTRKDLVKVIGKKVEEGKISIRNIREDIRKEIEKLESDNEISEDERYQLQDELDTLVKEVNSKIDELGKEKEAQVLKV